MHSATPTRHYDKRRELLRLIVERELVESQTTGGVAKLLRSFLRRPH
jgi:hypothetical protein